MLQKTQSLLCRQQNINFNYYLNLRNTTYQTGAICGAILAQYVIYIHMEYKPNYHITDELLAIIAKIEVLRSRIDTSYILPEREIEMRHRATVTAT